MLIAVERQAPITLPIASTTRLGLLAIATIATVCLVPATGQASLLEMLVLGAPAALMALWTLQVPVAGAIRVVDALYLGALPIAGPGATVTVAAIAELVRAARDLARGTERVTDVAWNALQNLLAAALGAIVFSAAVGALPLTIALLAAALTMAVTQATLGAALRATNEGVRLYLAMIPRRQVAMYLSVLAPLGLLLSTLYAAAPVALVFLLLPVALMYRSLENYTQVLGEARSTIEDMALAVERRDPGMAGHSARVAVLARQIAREMRVAEEDVDTLTTAARLHDLGKIAVPDSVLQKAGLLSEEEFEEIEAHATVGADVVARCALVQRQGDVASLIREHHERFDGRGYPYGLRGEEIKLGARILAVAEAWDTITTPRAWRVVLTSRQALQSLAAGSGTQFDPKVINAFFQVIARKEGTPVHEWSEQQPQQTRSDAAVAGRSEQEAFAEARARGRRPVSRRAVGQRRLA